MTSKLNLIVAFWGKMRGIGWRNDIPWPHLAQDMQHFRKITQGGGHNAVIMGKNTALSIPAQHMPLPGRHNIICSSTWCQNAAIIPPHLVHAECAPSLTAAIKSAHDAQYHEIFVIGGAQIYQQALLQNLDKIYITELDFPHDLTFDTFFPECDFSGYTKTVRQHAACIATNSGKVCGSIRFIKYQKI